MIEVAGLTRRYKDKLAVDDLSFRVEPGEVTGLLGPNGAGKSTTMRMIAGLDRPTAGTAHIDGAPFRDCASPMATLGALLDPTAVHRGRTGRTHLRALAASNGIRDERVDRVLEMTGMTDAAHHRISTYSLGMQQRIGIAATLLGEPSHLMLDEPVNGLDPDGVHWVRQLVRDLASTGCTVLISSHLMSEMSLTADRVIVIGRGRLIRDGSVAEVISSATRSSVIVRTPQTAQLAAAVSELGGQVEPGQDGSLVVYNTSAEAIGDRAAVLGIPLHELTPHTGSLEEAFLELTADAQDYRSDAGAEGMAV
jgi:ABC-2 type transport system ATP-binding protein